MRYRIHYRLELYGIIELDADDENEAVGIADSMPLTQLIDSSDVSDETFNVSLIEEVQP